MWMKKLRHIWDRSPESRMMYFQKGNHPQYAWNFAHHGQSMIGLHVTMFRQTVDQFSDEEQAKTWVPLTRNFDIHGCYAQTEIGHGSNVAGIETTATFDKESDCFDLHTPTKTATKWWPGDMGRFANHATVFAKVIIKDEDGNANDYGIGVFIV
jgi:acyl-CoA oxidase